MISCSSTPFPVVTHHIWFPSASMSCVWGELGILWGSPLAHRAWAETSRIRVFLKQRLNTQRKVLLQDIRLELNPSLGIQECYIMLRQEKYDVIFHTHILSEYLTKILAFSWVISLREFRSSMHHSGFSPQKRFINDFYVQLRRRKNIFTVIIERKGMKNAFFNF